MSGIIAQNTLDNTGLIKSPEGGGAWNFISKQTASSSATISFTSGLDSTYREYLFTFNNIHPATDDQDFGFLGSTDSGSSYGVAITSTHFSAYHDEADSSTSLGYDGSGNIICSVLSNWRLSICLGDIIVQYISSLTLFNCFIILHNTTTKQSFSKSF